MLSLLTLAIQRMPVPLGGAEPAILLAQFGAAEPKDLAVFLGIVLGLLMLYNQSRIALAHGKPGKLEQPLEVTASTRFAEKQDTERRLESLEKHVSDIHLKIHCSETAILAAGEERSIAIHNRINEQSSKVDNLAGKVEMLCKEVSTAATTARDAAITAARLAPRQRSHS